MGLGGLVDFVSVLCGLWSLTLLWHRDRGSANSSVSSGWNEALEGWFQDCEPISDGRRGGAYYVRSMWDVCSVCEEEKKKKDVLSRQM